MKTKYDDMKVISDADITPELLQETFERSLLNLIGILQQYGTEYISEAPYDNSTLYKFFYEALQHEKIADILRVAAHDCKQDILKSLEDAMKARAYQQCSHKIDKAMKEAEHRKKTGLDILEPYTQTR